MQETEPEPAVETETDAAVEDASGWVMSAVVIGGFNLLLLLGVGAWWFLRRRRGGGAAEDGLNLDELVEIADGATDASAAGAEEAGQEKAA